MLKMREFQCTQCGHCESDLIETNATLPSRFCPKCEARMELCLGVPGSGSTSIPTATIPDYPGSRRRKAGYQHKYVNRPAEKTQVGYGGGVSKGEGS